MRASAELWVMAYVRRLAGRAITAYVARRGEAERGAVWIKLATLDRKASLYGPAPAGLDDAGEERRFALAQGPADEPDIDARLARERGFDSDIWVIEIEDRAGRHLLDDELMPEPRA